DTPEFRPLWERMEEKREKKGLDAVIQEEGESEPLSRRIREEGERREMPLLAHSIRLFAEGKVYIEDQRLYQDGSPLDHPYDLSPEVDREIEE
ncbi:MAG: phosphoribosylglycinamide formyltransferase, partial [Methanomassiliicoccales archaeon]